LAGSNAKTIEYLSAQEDFFPSAQRATLGSFTVLITCLIGKQDERPRSRRFASLRETEFEQTPVCSHAHNSQGVMLPSLGEESQSRAIEACLKVALKEMNQEHPNLN